MFFFLVIYRRKSTWNNLLGLLSKESLVLFVNYIILYSLKQSPPHALFGKSSHVVHTFKLKCSEAHHLAFYYHTSSRKCPYLIVYDDIVIIVNDVARSSQLKEHLYNHFKTKDLKCLNFWALK